MKPYRLLLKNIKKSIKDYAIYFFTLILGVAIFYVFNAIESQAVSLTVSQSSNRIIQLMNTIMSGLSVFLAIVLGFLIIYASRFLMKRRNNEFGVYLTLGMSKRNISMVLFFETLLIGLASLIVGLIFGTALSQLMSLLVINMFEADMSDFAFRFSTSACIKTLIYFSIIYLLLMIFNTITIGKCKLIDLLYANRKSEEVKLKNPVVCVAVFVIAASILGYAYYLVTAGITHIETADKIMIPIIMGIVSTFFIFWSLSGLALRIIMSMKNTYYHNLNSFTLRQLSSKINTTVFSMTTICLMLFVTITVLSSSLSIKNTTTSNLIKLTPVDMQIEKRLDLEASNTVNYSKEQIADFKLSISESLNKLEFNVDKYLINMFEFNTYRSFDITFQDTLGSSFEEVSDEYPHLVYHEREILVKISDYNRLARLYGMQEIDLGPNEYFIIANYEMFGEIRNIALKNNESITILNKNYLPKFDKYLEGFIYMARNPSNLGVFIVPDEAVDESMHSSTIMVADYQASTKEEKEAIENIVSNFTDKSYYMNTQLQINSKIVNYEASIGSSAMVTFIGLYLGIIFLISCAAILALKELSESSDNKDRFTVLRKIGTDEKMINKALFNQILLFFMFPLILSIIHSIFGIQFCNNTLLSIGVDYLLPSIALTAVLLVFILVVTYSLLIIAVKVL